MSGDLTLEDILIFEARDYREVSGASGTQLAIKECPNCGKDKWDKVYANKDSSLGNCFSCDKRFNMFKFCGWILKQKGGAGTNRDIGAYLNEVRRQLGYRPKAEKPKARVAVADGDFELPQSMALPDLNGKNHSYLEQRGIDGAHAKMFHLRYSMFGFHSYKDEKGEPRRQSFSERIIFPVYNLDGLCITFQGRDVTGTSDTRYKFAGGLPGTGRYLYNGHTAKALKAKHVLMNEGPTDVIKAQIALSQAPDLAHIVPVGSFGMNLSKTSDGDDQVRAFNRLRNEAGLEIVTILWDGEEEAYSKALEAGEKLMKLGLRVFIAFLPKPTPEEKAAGIKSHDPGSVDARVIHTAIREAKELSRLSLLRMKMSNPYKVR